MTTLTMKTQTKKLNPRQVFWKCGACSHAMFHLLNNESGNLKPIEEKASDMLAGGIAQKGEQCGMLWGGSLAIGTVAYRKFENKDQAIASAIHASTLLLNSFYNRNKTVNCRDISKVDWENKFQMAFYVIKTFAQGFVFNPCFNLIVKWTPEAAEVARTGLEENISYSSPCISCASKVVKEMGGSEEESVMAAGFAGGIGLSGNACGALAAAIWYKMLIWEKNNQGKSQTLFDNPDAKRVMRAFYIQTDSEMLCKNICKRKFDTIDEHSEYIRNGGCKNIIDALAKA